MNCCTSCFGDSSLQNIIKTRSTQIGNCDFCDSKQLIIIPCEQLSELFDSLFELYVNHQSARLSLKKDRSTLLHEHLCEYWPNLFNHKLLKVKDVKHLINQIGRSWIGFSESIFEKPVELKMYADGKFENEDYTLHWETFTKELKEQNRFFLSERLDLDDLEGILSKIC